MINLTTLGPQELELLAQSRFGGLKPSEVPENWRERLEDDLKERNVLAEDREDDSRC